VRAERWYGNLVLTTQRTNTTPVGVTDGDMYTAHANVNVEDVLFYKNRFRLAGNLDWRRETGEHTVYRPIYYADVFGYGYAINSSYSPYKRRMPGATGSLVDVHTRDWRSSLAVTVPKYPTLSIVFNRIRSWDKEMSTASNYLQRTAILEGYYSRALYSVRGNYYRARNDDLRIGKKADIIHTASGTVSCTTPSSRFGNANVSFNYYDTRRSIADTSISRGHTSSVAAMASSSYFKRINAAVSYSGRFTQSPDRSGSAPRAQSEAMSAAVGYAPTSYIELQATKGYQIDGSRRQYAIMEYVSVAASASRYLRQGVETRLSVTRTAYQQSNRVVEYRNSLGQLDSTRRLSRFVIDTWYGSLGFSPAPYVKTTAGFSISRDSYPIPVDRRYQMTGTVDAQLAFRRNLEGRFSYSNNYMGSTLRIGHAFSDTYNIGLGWLPRGNVNVNVSYTYSSYNTLVRNTSSSLNLYAGYTYRRVYSLSVSYSRRDQSDGTGSPSPQASLGQPVTLNTQLLIYLSPRSTLTLGHVRDQSEFSDIGRRIIQTWQGRLNIQL
jgi:hypothetical protein